MAMPLNKSTSSPIPGRANPNARSSEIGNAMRRSFTGNPFSKIVPDPRGLNPNIPANSPSEHPRRNSVSRESAVTLGNNEDKENGKMAKLRSPMGPKGSGTKNFMSPTISAASKINASQRKRILKEKNELVRASISFSDLKIASFDQAISDSSYHKEEEQEILPAPLVSTDLKAKSDSKPKKVVFVEPEIVNLEPSFKISPPPPCSCSPSSPIIAPLDSDPLAPPYDPKSNYLSPRPRFLHYKPNPLVELYLSKKNEGKQLDDSLASRSFSDSDVTEEEEEEIQSESLLKESEADVFLGEEVRAEEEEEEEEEELIVSEPSPIDAVISDETVEAKCEFKPRLLWRSKLTALLIIFLSIICVSISVANSPVIDYSVFDGLPAFLEQYDHPTFLEFAKSSFNGIAQRFRVWYANSICFFSELIFNLRGARNVEPLHYFNLTALVDDDYSSFDDYKINVFVPAREMREFHIEAAEIIVENKELQIDGSVVAETSEVHFSSDWVEVDQAQSAEVVELESSVEKKSQEENDLSSDFEDDPVPISQVDEAQPEVSEAEVSQDKVDRSSGAEMEATREDFLGSETPEVGASSGGSKGSEEVDVAVDERTEYSFSEVSVLGIALLVLAIIASTGAVFVKKSIASTLKASDVGQGLVTKKFDSSPTPSKLENTLEQRPSSWDCSGESCPSEISSYHNTSYNTNKKSLNSLNQAQSYERKPRKNQTRESMASSSMDSSMGTPSYGSFTTYEKIPTKYGHGDEEVITPVRRSNRLRSHVTSP